MSKSVKKRFLHWLRDAVAPRLSVRLYKAYFALVRKDIQGWDEHVTPWLKKGPVIFAHFHGDDLALLCPFAWTGFTIMVSKSKDGDLLDLILRRLGYTTVRGSSRKGGLEALKMMAEILKGGRSVILTVDGPTGPRGVVKHGCVTLAKWSGAPIFAAGVAADRKYVFEKTWHKTYLPYPGAKVSYRFAEPILVDPEADGEALEAKRAEVQAELERLHRLAENG